MVKKKICVITGSRSEYGLLKILMKDISKTDCLQLQTVVTGMHLSPEFGYTINEIKKDGFVINKKVEMLLSSDSSVGISKSTGLGIIGFADAFEELNPDMIILLGDRFETLSAAVAAMFFRIPISHIHGGEITEGAYDEAIRHSLTKISYLHFVSTNVYKNRVIQLGESPERVFNVGALGCQIISKHKFLSKKELEDDILFKFGKKNILVTYHPETLQVNSSTKDFDQLLKALNSFPDINILFTYPNADNDGRVIISMINEYCKANKNAHFIPSLGSKRYLSFIKYCDGVIGNSSSSIIELPSLKKGAINIGNRQKGRVFGDNIINTIPEKNAIINAIKVLFSNEFKNKLKKIKNPYDNGNTSNKIIEVIKHYQIDASLVKSFHDINGI
jgi:GDP/UDP-N,N'-diacetylbacillosamine 2-epimerase (hydrolysing)